MLPLISFETGRKTQTQSCGQPAELRQPMEVWFYPRIETAAERPTPSAENSKSLHPRSSRRVGRAFALLTKTYHGSRVTVQLAPSTRLYLRGKRGVLEAGKLVGNLYYCRSLCWELHSKNK